MNLTKTQSNHIQILRGCAILAVVFIHHTPHGLPQVWIRPILNFCVGLFLFLSGLLSTKRRWNPQKRIRKVLVPYVIWSFVYVCLSHIGSYSDIPLAYGKALLFGNAAAMMYYIFVYCQFALLIPLIDKLGDSKYKYLGFLISPIEILGMRSLPWILGYQNPSFLQPIVDLSCLGWFSYFYLGYLIGNGKLTVCRRRLLWIGLLGVSLVLQVLEGYWYLSLGYANAGTQLKLSALFSGICFAVCGYLFIFAKKEYSAKWLRALGDASFGIYFSHVAVMTVFKHLPLYETHVIYPINAVLTVVFSFLLCYLGKRVLKRFAWLIAL